MVAVIAAVVFPTSAHFRPFTKELRRLGFRRTGASTLDHERVVEYSLQIPDLRTVYIQLWSAGKHRASHWINGSMATLPSNFTTLDQMRAAINHERTRLDHPYFACHGGGQ